MPGRQQWKLNSSHNLHGNSSSDEEAPKDEATVSCESYENGVVVTLGGYSTLDGPLENQDRALVQQLASSSAILLGVFDGHDNDGGLIADCVKNDFPKLLNTKLCSQDGHDDGAIVKALTETFSEINQSVSPTYVGGCTASIVLRWGHKIYIANVGDSSSILATFLPATSSTNVIYETRKDLPNDPSERARIEQMGGSVSLDGRIMYRDGCGNLRPGVAMSRSIGDRDMVGTIAEPTVHIVDLQQACTNEETALLCILATDGMTDFSSAEDLVGAFGGALCGVEDACSVARTFCHRAKCIWQDKTGGQYRDDITLVAFHISK